MPPPSELRFAFWASDENKANGEDLMHGKVMKRSADALSKIFFPIYVKTFLRLAAPLQWRGGMLIELFKCKGSATRIANYRDIILADNTAKILG
eukprot:3005419-Karenia_brevis.AAC.1